MLELDVVKNREQLESLKNLSEAIIEEISNKNDGHMDKIKNYENQLKKIDRILGGKNV